MAISVGKESRLLARHSMIYGLGTAVNKAAAFLLLPIYTHYLTTHDYGVKELVALSTDILTTIIATAISSAFYRFYFEYKGEHERNLVLSSSYIFLGVSGFFFVGALALMSPIMARYILNSPEYYTYFLIAFASMWFQMIMGIGLNYLRASMKSIQYFCISMLRLFLAIGLNIYFIIFLHLGVLGILLSTLITSIVTFLVLNVPQFLKTGLRFSPVIVKEMLKFGLPMIPSELASWIVLISDRFFIKAYWSIADAGLYALSFRFGLLPGMFVSEPFNQVWQPRRLEVYNHANSEAVFGKIFTYYLVLISFAALGVAVLAKDILMVIADKPFWSAYKIVPIIVLANVIFTLQYHFNIGIIIEKKTHYFAYINVSNGILNLLLNFLLIPRYGGLGAAYATLISFIYLITMTYYFSSRFFKINFEFMRLMKIFVAALIIYIISKHIAFSSIYMSMIVKVMVIFTFPLMLFLLGFFTPKEKSVLSTLLKPDLSMLRFW